MIIALVLIIVYYFVDAWKDWTFKPHVIERKILEHSTGCWEEWIWYTEKRGETKFTIIWHEKDDPKSQ